MSSKRALLAQAQAHAAGLRLPHTPTACPACLILFAYQIRDTKASMLWLRFNCHTFFDVLIAFLTAGWTAAQRASAKRALRDAQSRCLECALKSLEPTDVADEFEVAYEAAVLGLGFALADRQMRIDKGFGSLRGLWPVSSEQLFPGGPERTLGALVRLWEDGGATAMTIGDLAGAHWPLVYPILSNTDNRPRVMRAMVSDARAAEAAMHENLARMPQPVVPGVRDRIANQQVDTCKPWVRLLRALIHNPDATEGDRPEFFHGYEAELLRVAPMHALLSNLDGAPRGLAYMMADFATEFRMRLSPAQRARVGCAVPPPYTRIVADNFQRQLADPYLALRFALPQQTSRRECHGPGCGKPVHDKGTPGGFARCARCGVARYCSRECQRADWARGPRPHKAVCAVLRRLLSFVDMDMSDEQFAAACRAHDFPLEDADRLVDWASNGRFTAQNAEMLVFPLTFTG